MARALGRFLFGAFVEFLQLLLLLVAALFAIEIAVGRDLHSPIANDIPRAPSQASFILLIVYSLLVWWPARDLVEGWLGLVSRRLPDRYEHRAENLGRGVCAVAFSIFWIVLWFVLEPDVNTAQGEAFDRSYALLALFIFGLGGAVPRLWFGLKRSAWQAPSEIPELLREAGKRGAIFIIALFAGIALGFIAAYSVQVKRPDYVAPSLPSAPVLGSLETFGDTLCRVPSKTCPATRNLVPDRALSGSPHALRIEVMSYGEPPICDVVPDAAWHVDDETKAWFADRTDDIRERIVPVPPSANTVALTARVPEGLDRCTFFVSIEPADDTALTDAGVPVAIMPDAADTPPGEALPGSTVADLELGRLCQPATKTCPASERIRFPRVQSRHPTQVTVSTMPNGKPPLCDLAPTASWPLDDDTRGWFAARTDDLRDRDIAVPPRATMELTATVPAGLDHCSYFVEMKLLEGGP